ncbi:Inner membrane protein YjcH [Azoarcus sp. Aa7]|nr:Inner membrane protein YjcH [Azoarcus sp. Aa7]
MQNDMVTKIVANPKYQQLVSTRSSFGWILTAIMMIVYYGYIAVIAFNKGLFAQRLGDGVMTVGIPVGLGVILFTVIITGLYVRRANSEFDALTQDIVKESSK